MLLWKVGHALMLAHAPTNPPSTLTIPRSTGFTTTFDRYPPGGSGAHDATLENATTVVPTLI